MQSINNIRRKPDYYLHDAPKWVRNIWPRPESFNWWVKANRKDLMAAGALVRLGRDHFVDAAIFPKVAERLLGFKPDEH